MNRRSFLEAMGYAGLALAGLVPKQISGPVGDFIMMSRQSKWIKADMDRIHIRWPLIPAEWQFFCSYCAEWTDWDGSSDHIQGHKDAGDEKAKLVW